MKVFVIDGIIFGLQKSGGISRSWAEFILGLDETLARTTKTYLLLPSNSNVEWDEIKKRLKFIKILKRPRLGFSFFLNRLYLSFLAWVLKPDYWHTSYYLGLPWRGCAKKIAPLYDMIQEIYNLDPLHSRQKYATFKSATHIISISHHSKNDLERIWPDVKAQKKVIYITSSQVIKNEQSTPLPSLIFLGRRGGYKNFLACLKALFQDPFFDSYEIVVVGGEESWYEEERECFDQHNAWKKIRKLGLLTVLQTQNEIAKASAVLYPSLYEGFGLPVLEAFQLQTPVLACRTSSIPEVTGEEYPLVNPQDPLSYCSTLKELLLERARWIHYGNQRAKLFSREKMVEQTLEVYQLTN